MPQVLTCGVVFPLTIKGVTRRYHVCTRCIRTNAKVS